MGAFATAITPSWYVVSSSKELAPGSVRAVRIGDKRLAVWRDQAGAAHVVEARCPHLGGDLAAGTVEEGALVCPFHGWRIGIDGKCAPGGRVAHTFVVEERFGFVWAWVGGDVAWALPEIGEGRSAWVLPEQRLNAHPHLVIGNGLDAQHYDRVHDLVFTSPPRFERDGPACALHFEGRPRSAFLRRVSGTVARPLVAAFHTLGGNLAVARVKSPVRFDILFTARPEGGACVSRAALFAGPGPLDWLRSAFIMRTLLARDREVIEGTEFRRAFTAEDEAIAGFAELVDSLGEVR
jgi:nitrite reductase/ring-hydroxylating ferredoxin subunit